ncbi:MAG: hypothetical protein ACLUF9_03235 [Oscillospiraceae bacterium]
MRKPRRRFSKQPGYIRKPRRTYSKKTGYIWVSIALIAVAVIELAAKASVFMVVSLYSIVIIPIIIKKFKYEPAQGSMIISGLIRTGIWLAIWIAMAFLSRISPLAAKISLWPISPA